MRIIIFFTIVAFALSFTCYGLDESHPDVCYGFGECIGENNCLCDDGFTHNVQGCDVCDWTVCSGDKDALCAVTAPGQVNCTCGLEVPLTRRGVSGFVEDCMGYVLWAGINECPAHLETTSTTVNAGTQDSILLNVKAPYVPIDTFYIQKLVYTCQNDSTIIPNGGQIRFAIYEDLNGAQMSSGANIPAIWTSPAYDIKCVVNENSLPTVIDYSYGPIPVPTTGNAYYLGIWISDHEDLSVVMRTVTVSFGGTVQQSTVGLWSTTGPAPSFTIDWAPDTSPENLIGLDIKVGTPDTPLFGPRCEFCTVPTVSDGMFAGAEVTGYHYDGFCYYTFSDPDLAKKDWQETRSFCKDNFHGASDIPVVFDDKHADAVMTVKGNKLSWIMLSDRDNLEEWHWIDHNTTLDYTNWNPTVFPWSGSDNCAYMHWRKYWLNHHCFSKVSMGAVTCQLDLMELYHDCHEGNHWINVGYHVLDHYRYDFTNYWCDWRAGKCDNCPPETKLCCEVPGVFVDKDSPDVCGYGNGTCTFGKPNYCVCNPGRQGECCEFPDPYVPPNGPEWECKPWGNYCYLFKKYPLKKWWDAREWCRTAWFPHADLAIIRNKGVQDLLESMQGKWTAWIGGAAYTDYLYKWNDHSAMDYQRWTYKRKDDGLEGIGQDCVAIHGTNKGPRSNMWETANCAIYWAWHCEILLDDAINNNVYASELWKNVDYTGLNTDTKTCECRSTNEADCPVGAKCGEECQNSGCGVGR